MAEYPVIVLINANETQVNTSATAALDSYSLAANSFSRIIFEGEGYVVGADNGSFEWNVQVRIDSIAVGNAVLVAAAQTGTGDIFKIPFTIKWSQAQTAAATIDVYAWEILDTGTLYLNSLRLYGVV